MTSDGTLYRHYKGGLYRFLYLAIHSETGEQLAVYRALHEAGPIWARPAEMFFGFVEIDGRTIPRFEVVDKED